MNEINMTSHRWFGKNWQSALFDESGRRRTDWAPVANKQSFWRKTHSTFRATRAVLWDGDEEMVITELDMPVVVRPGNTLTMTFYDHPELGP